jgi:hypothetical protein
LYPLDSIPEASTVQSNIRNARVVCPSIALALKSLIPKGPYTQPRRFVASTVTGGYIVSGGFASRVISFLHEQSFVRGLVLVQYHTV